MRAQFLQFSLMVAICRVMNTLGSARHRRSTAVRLSRTRKVWPCGHFHYLIMVLMAAGQVHTPQDSFLTLFFCTLFFSWYRSHYSVLILMFLLSCFLLPTHFDCGCPLSLSCSLAFERFTATSFCSRSDLHWRCTFHRTAGWAISTSTSHTSDVHF